MRTNKSRNKRNIAILAGLLAVILLGLGLWMWLRPAPIIPKNVTKKANFAVFVPDSEQITIGQDAVQYDDADQPVLDSAEVSVEQASGKYNSSEKLLSYIIKIDGIEAVVSQQATPELFIDVPAAFDKVLESSNQYKKFEVPLGVVHLVRPASLKGKQAAMMNTKGTLMFVKPSADLSEDQWRLFFRNLVIQK